MVACVVAIHRVKTGVRGQGVGDILSNNTVVDCLAGCKYAADVSEDDVVVFDVEEVYINVAVVAQYAGR